MTELLEQFFSAVRDMDPVWRTLLAALGLFLETSAFIGLVVPGDSIALIAASGVSTPAQFAWLIAAITVWSLSSEALKFCRSMSSAGAKLRSMRCVRSPAER